MHRAIPEASVPARSLMARAGTLVLGNNATVPSPRAKCIARGMPTDYSPLLMESI